MTIIAALLFTACDTAAVNGNQDIPTDQEPEDVLPEVPGEDDAPAEQAFYTKVSQTYEDWSGEYIITYSGKNSIIVFDSMDGNKGLSNNDLFEDLTDQGIPAEKGDPFKATISKV